MNSSELSEKFRQRTKLFTIRIIAFSKSLPKSPESQIILKQLIRSVASTAANYRAACRARSNTEFFSKLSIVVEEADESVFWLEIIHEANLVNEQEVLPLLREANEILAIVASSRKTMRNKLFPNQ
ncbi:MAG: four helix bundle protein [Bacteroidetes bacterium]|nr:four helix bundle protein [Bacteroidota bacterium]